MQNACYGFSVVGPYLLDCGKTFLYAGTEHDGQNGITAQSDFLYDRLRHAQTLHHRVQPEDVTPSLCAFHEIRQVTANAFLVTFLQRGAQHLFHFSVEPERFFAFLCGKNQSFCHSRLVYLSAKV